MPGRPFINEHRVSFVNEPPIEDILAARERRRRLNAKYSDAQLVLAAALSGFVVLTVCLLVLR